MIRPQLLIHRICGQAQFHSNSTMSHEKQCEPSSEGDHVSFLFSLPAVGRAGPLNEAGGLPDEPWPVWLLGSKLILDPPLIVVVLPTQSAWEMLASAWAVLGGLVVLSVPSQPSPLPTTGFACTCAADAGTAL